MAKHILIPVALDHEGLVERKIDLARKLLEPGGRITLLTVLERVPGFVAEFVMPDSENHLTAKIRGKLEAVTSGSDDLFADVAVGKPGLKIAEYATEHGVDLIVVGSQEPDAEGYFLGSTAARVARRAPCSVMILR